MNDLSGLDQLREMIAEKAQPSIGRTLDFSLIEVGDGLAVFEGNPDERTYNPTGTVHGGYAQRFLTPLAESRRIRSLRLASPTQPWS